MPVFCRHNRFTAECPICSKGTVLDQSERPRRRAAGRGGRGAPRTAAPFVGRHASAGPYEDEDGRYEVRLERVPGGLRLASWSGGQIRRAAPVLPAGDVAGLVAAGAEEVLRERDGAELRRALEPGPAAPAEDGFGASAGRTGELRDELRVERLEDGRVRIARWVYRPNRGWELQQAPVMLPAARFAEALAAAARAGLLSGATASARPL